MRWIAVPAGLLAIAILGAAANGEDQAKPTPTSVWELLQQNYDGNKDGTITKEEYSREDDKFTRYDRTGDGVLTSADFEGSEQRGMRRGGGRRSGGSRRGGMQDMTRMAGMMAARAADADKSGDVTTKELETFLDSLDADDSGAIDPKTLDKVMASPMSGGGTVGGGNRSFRGMARMFDKDRDGVVTVDEIQGFLAALDKNDDRTIASDEMPSMRSRGGRSPQAQPGLPQAGDIAPDFDLPYAADKSKTVKLSSYAGKKPVALIFGSYT